MMFEQPSIRGREMSERELARCIDHTQLKAEATRDEVLRLCEEARTYGFHGVCVNGRWLSLVADELQGTPVKIVGAVSLPFGADTTRMKVAQAREAIREGADEIDMVADGAAILQNEAGYLLQQLQVVLRECRSMRPPVLLTVVIESAALTQEQKLFACQIAQQIGVDSIGTGTDFHPAGAATVEDIRLIKEAAPRCKIKAAGGIQTAEQALAAIEAGAARIGTSSGVRIIEELRASAGK